MRDQNPSFEHQYALECAEILFRGVLRGESSMCYWFPGGGKSTVVSNIVNSKKIQESVLGGMRTRLKLVSFVCSDTVSGGANEVLKNICSEMNISVVSDEANLGDLIKEKCLENLDQGLETVFIGDRLEELGETQLQCLLHALGSTIFVNKNRIHAILNCFNRPLMDKIFLSDPISYGLAQNCEFVPLPQGDLLNRYLSEHSENLKVHLSKSEREDLVFDFGGLLFLQIACLRQRSSQKNVKNLGFPLNSSLQTRLQSIWLRTPLPYQEIICKIWQKQTVRGQLEQGYLSDLTEMGVITQSKSGVELVPKVLEKFLPQLTSVAPLEIDADRQTVFACNLDLAKKLTNKELSVLYGLMCKKGTVVSRDEIADLLWREKAEIKFSSWAIDKTVSRLRKKLVSLGYPEDMIRTFKDSGYRMEI